MKLEFLALITVGSASLPLALQDVVKLPSVSEASAVTLLRPGTRAALQEVAPEADRDVRRRSLSFSGPVSIELQQDEQGRPVLRTRTSEGSTSILLDEAEPWTFSLGNGEGFSVIGGAEGGALILDGEGRLALESRSFTLESGEGVTIVQSQGGGDSLLFDSQGSLIQDGNCTPSMAGVPSPGPARTGLARTGLARNGQARNGQASGGLARAPEAPPIPIVDGSRGTTFVTAPDGRGLAIADAPGTRIAITEVPGGGYAVTQTPSSGVSIFDGETGNLIQDGNCTPSMQGVPSAGNRRNGVSWAVPQPPSAPEPPRAPKLIDGRTGERSGFRVLDPLVALAPSIPVTRVAPSAPPAPPTQDPRERPRRNRNRDDEGCECCEGLSEEGYERLEREYEQLYEDAAEEWEDLYEDLYEDGYSEIWEEYNQLSEELAREMEGLYEQMEDERQRAERAQQQWWKEIERDRQRAQRELDKAAERQERTYERLLEDIGKTYWDRVGEGQDRARVLLREVERSSCDDDCRPGHCECHEGCEHGGRREPCHDGEEIEEVSEADEVARLMLQRFSPVLASAPPQAQEALLRNLPEAANRLQLAAWTAVQDPERDYAHALAAEIEAILADRLDQLHDLVARGNLDRSDLTAIEADLRRTVERLLVDLDPVRELGSRGPALEALAVGEAAQRSRLMVEDVAVRIEGLRAVLAEQGGQNPELEGEIERLQQRLRDLRTLAEDDQELRLLAEQQALLAQGRQAELMEAQDARSVAERLRHEAEHERRELDRLREEMLNEMEISRRNHQNEREAMRAELEARRREMELALERELVARGERDSQAGRAPRSSRQDDVLVEIERLMLEMRSELQSLRGEVSALRDDLRRLKPGELR